MLYVAQLILFVVGVQTSRDVSAPQHDMAAVLHRVHYVSPCMQGSLSASLSSPLDKHALLGSTPMSCTSARTLGDVSTLVHDGSCVSQGAFLVAEHAGKPINVTKLSLVQTCSVYVSVPKSCADSRISGDVATLYMTWGLCYTERPSGGLACWHSCQYHQALECSL